MDQSKCPQCGGTGTYTEDTGHERPCPDCNGTGKKCSGKCSLTWSADGKPVVNSPHPNCPVHGFTANKTASDEEKIDDRELLGAEKKETPLPSPSQADSERELVDLVIDGPKRSKDHVNDLLQEIIQNAKREAVEEVLGEVPDVIKNWLQTRIPARDTVNQVCNEFDKYFGRRNHRTTLKQKLEALKEHHE